MKTIGSADVRLGEPASREPTRGLGPRRVVLARAADWAVARAGLAVPVALISGFWRSGTTWLQEILADSVDAKTVFEPLSPCNPPRRSMLEAAGVTNYAFSEAHIPPAAGPRDPLWTCIDAALLDGRCSQFTYACRTGIRDSLRRRIVVKDVRLQFNLAGAYERYGIPVIHIRRHPLAIVNSLISAAWPWTFDDVRLVEMLPDRAAELTPFDTDAVSRITALWAVTERAVDDTLQGRPWGQIVDYGELLSAPRMQLPALCEFIGYPQRRVPDYAAPSISTVFKPGPKLAPEQSARVRRIVAALYPQFAFDAASGPVAPVH
jgi:hypothetical protein